MKRNQVLFAVATSLPLYLATNANAKVWILADLVREDGLSATMSFDHTSETDVTLEECEKTIDSVIPDIRYYVNETPQVAGATVKNVRCVVSDTDPTRPQ